MPRQEDIALCEIVMSLKPQWWRKMLAGEKVEEIRKTMPVQIPILSDYSGVNRYEPFKVYVYVSGTGRIMGHFMCPYIAVFDSAFSEWAYSVAPPGSIMPMSDTQAFSRMREKGCLTDEQITDYLGDEDYKAYFWGVADVVQYEKSKSLSELGLKRPPQSWCYMRAGQ